MIITVTYVIAYNKQVTFLFVIFWSIHVTCIYRAETSRKCNRNYVSKQQAEVNKISKSCYEGLTVWS